MHRGAMAAESLLRARFSAHVNEAILEKALSLGLEDFEDPDTLDQLNRARKGASYRPLDMVQGIFGLGQSVLTLLAYGGLMVSIAGWMLLLIVFAAVPEFVVQTRFSRDAFRLFNWRTPEMRRQQYYEAVLTDADSVKEVRLFGLGPLFFARYRELFHRFWKEDRDLTLRRSAWGLLLETLSNVAYYAAYVWVVLRAVSGALSLGGVGLFVGVFRDAQGIVGNILHTIGRTYEDHLYLTSLYAFLDHVPAAQANGAATAGPRPDDGVRFENVSFTYPDAEKPVLTDVNLHLPRGHKLALVGENGAGKTTLIKLLTRLYRPTAGRVTLDGLDLNAWDEAALRRRVGVIFQDFVQYQFVVGENIGVGDVPASTTPTRGATRPSAGSRTSSSSRSPRATRRSSGKWFADGQRALPRAVAEGGPGAGVHAPRRRHPRARRAHGLHGRRRRGEVFERFRALTEHRIGRGDLAPLLDRAHGRHHRRARRGQDHRARHARRAPRARRALRRALLPPGPGLPLSGHHRAASRRTRARSSG
jgi:ATP-binding cassette subfamily B protein